MSATETWTVGRLLTWTTDYLKQHQSHSPRLDAEVLLAHARGCKRIELYTAFDDQPDDECRTAFREMVRRRAEGTPVAYLVGYKEFYADIFEVNPDVLIPRPETEHLVVEGLDQLKQLHDQRQHPLHVADVGTGSGAIGISIARHFSDCQVTAIDVSQTALEVARRNAATHELGDDRIQFVESDLFTALPAEERFDVILSNPPYVSEPEYEQLDKTVKDYEPKLALVGGPEGFEVIQRLLKQAGERIAPDGVLLFEFSPMLAARLPEFCSEDWHTPEIIKDLAGQERVVVLRPNSSKSPASESSDPTSNS